MQYYGERYLNIRFSTRVRTSVTTIYYHSFYLRNSRVLDIVILQNRRNNGHSSGTMLVI